MTEPKFKFCPKCGNSLKVTQEGHDESQVCSACNFHYYKNQFVTVSGVLVRGSRILFVRRAIAPYVGMLDLPGGYVNADEPAPLALIREMKEELGVDVSVGKLLGYFGPDAYPFGGILNYNACLIYSMETSDLNLIAQDDVSELVWCELSNLPAKDECAFLSHQQFIDALQNSTVVL